MDWFLHDRNLRHERVKLQGITNKLKTSLTKDMKNVTETKNQTKSPYLICLCGYRKRLTRKEAYQA